MKRGIDNFSFPASLVLSLFGFCCLLLPFDIHFLEPGFTLFYSTLEYDSLVLFYAVFIGLCACLAISLAGMKVPSFTLKIALLIVDIVSLVFLVGLMASGAYGIGTIFIGLVLLAVLGCSIADVRVHYLSDFTERKPSRRSR